MNNPFKKAPILVFIFLIISNANSEVAFSVESLANKAAPNEQLSQDKAVQVASDFVVTNQNPLLVRIRKPKARLSKYYTDVNQHKKCWLVSFPSTWKTLLTSGLLKFEVAIDASNGHVLGSGWLPD